MDNNAPYYDAPTVTIIIHIFMYIPNLGNLPMDGIWRLGQLMVLR
jgi:hypothetical protein